MYHTCYVLIKAAHTIYYDTYVCIHIHMDTYKHRFSSFSLGHGIACGFQDLCAPRTLPGSDAAGEVL